MWKYLFILIFPSSEPVFLWSENQYLTQDACVSEANAIAYHSIDLILKDHPGAETLIVEFHQDKSI